MGEGEGEGEGRFNIILQGGGGNMLLCKGHTLCIFDIYAGCDKAL